MHLSADRLDVVAGERVHAILIVSASLVSALAPGGLDLRLALEDVGFRDVRLLVRAPSSWAHGDDVPRSDGAEWRLWIEATPIRAASMRRELTADMRVAAAWDAREDERPGEREAPVISHPYEVVFHWARCACGALRPFAIAYPVWRRC